MSIKDLWYEAVRPALTRTITPSEMAQDYEDNLKLEKEKRYYGLSTMTPADYNDPLHILFLEDVDIPDGTNHLELGLPMNLSELTRLIDEEIRFESTDPKRDIAWTNSPKDFYPKKGRELHASLEELRLARENPAYLIRLLYEEYNGFFATDIFGPQANSLQLTYLNMFTRALRKQIRINIPIEREPYGYEE
jgi:hypothetical protein